MATQSSVSSSSPFNQHTENNELNINVSIEERIEQTTTISEGLDIITGSNDNIVPITASTQTETGIHSEVDVVDIKGSLVGVRKNTPDDMYKLYCAHGKAIGFSVRKSTTRVRDNGIVFYKYFVCSNAGTKKQSKSKSKYDSDGEIENPRKHHFTRTGCSAAMRINLTEDNNYEVVTHITDHNHALTRADLSHLHRSQRQITNEKGKAIEQMLSSGIKATDSFRYMAHEAGGDDCVGHTIKDHLNFVNRLKMKEREHGDAQRLVEILYEQQSEEGDFFFRVMLDESGRLSRIFWRDSMMKEDYLIFGDVMIFDTTYSTNKYGMICAPMVGINNHKNNVMFGCAFLANEETKSFEWLFDVFKKSMGGKCPITIFTDQYQTITNAISTVFPTTKHRLCQWHLYLNAISRFGQLKSNNEFKYAFKRCMSGCVDEDHFEKTWSKMIKDYNLEEEPWFKRLYDLRHKWSTTLNKDFFSAGILSSQRSESTNSAMGNHAKKTTSLTEFHDIFKKMLQNWRMKEKQAEFKTSKSIPSSSVPLSGLLKHASEIYTLEVFEEFEKQFIQSIGMKCELYDSDEMITTYSISAFEGVLTRFVMIGNTTTDFLKCSCKYFEECGIICRHMVRVLYQQNQLKIPEAFILKRWTRIVKSSVWDKLCNIQEPQNNLSYITWKQEMIRKFYNLVLEAQHNDEARRILEESYGKDVLAISSLKNIQEETESSHVSSTSNAIMDPARSVTKGRKKRIQPSIEKGKKKKTSEVHTSHQSREFGTKTPNIRLF